MCRHPLQAPLRSDVGSPLAGRKVVASISEAEVWMRMWSLLAGNVVVQNCAENNRITKLRISQTTINESTAENIHYN